MLVIIFHCICNKHWLFKQNISFIDLDTISFYFKSDVKGEVFPHNHLKLTHQFLVILIWFWSTIYKIYDLYLISKFCQYYRKYYAIGPSVLGWQKLNLFGGSYCLWLKVALLKYFSVARSDDLFLKNKFLKLHLPRTAQLMIQSHLGRRLLSRWLEM